jgi:hypothetical protein
MGYLFSLSILGAIMTYGTFETLTNTCPDDHTATDDKTNDDFGFLGHLFQLCKCSPWVAWVGANASFHFFWVTTLTICQVYQVSTTSC